ncbi:MAG: hypothetical protein IS860_02410 [Nitrosopumilus sp.]|nr:hypothetical protein [Nitrosopumilus sp.]
MISVLLSPGISSIHADDDFDVQHEWESPDLSEVLMNAHQLLLQTT